MSVARLRGHEEPAESSDSLLRGSKSSAMPSRLVAPSEIFRQTCLDREIATNPRNTQLTTPEGFFLSPAFWKKSCETCSRTLWAGACSVSKTRRGGMNNLSRKHNGNVELDRCLEEGTQLALLHRISGIVS